MRTDSVYSHVVDVGKLVISVEVLVVVVLAIVVWVVVEVEGIVGVVVCPQGISCHSQQFTLIS